MTLLASDYISELIQYERHENLPIMRHDRWVFLFAKDYLIILGKDHQRVALSARNPGQVIMHYSFVK